MLTHTHTQYTNLCTHAYTHMFCKFWLICMCVVVHNVGAFVELCTLIAIAIAILNQQYTNYINVENSRATNL